MVYIMSIALCTTKHDTLLNTLSFYTFSEFSDLEGINEISRIHYNANVSVQISSNPTISCRDISVSEKVVNWHCLSCSHTASMAENIQYYYTLNAIKTAQCWSWKRSLWDNELKQLACACKFLTSHLYSSCHSFKWSRQAEWMPLENNYVTITIPPIYEAALTKEYISC